METMEDVMEPPSAQTVADAARRGAAVGAGHHGDRAFLERCRYIPMRLTADERKLLSLLQSALDVSEYTDKVDTISSRRKQDRILDALNDLISICCGLHVCGDPRRGEKLVAQGLESDDMEAFMQRVCEVGRRYKIMNPSKMRTTYGKLMYILQDAQSRLIQTQLNMSFHKPLVMVLSFLEERGGSAVALLHDARIKIATEDVSAYDTKGKPRSRTEINARLEVKRGARAQLIEAFASGEAAPLTVDEVDRVISSIDDANTYLSANVTPVERIIDLLEENFDPLQPEKQYSLQINSQRTYYRGGPSGSKLSHNHQTQYTFCLQTFTLWREVMTNMYKLWYLADEDLLSGGGGGGYQLWNTGQGLNRVQRCPKVAAEMSGILGRVQKAVGHRWVGLSVVHLGDRDVPNALVFIDKYTQVPRILSPIVQIVEQLESPDSVFNADPAISAYLKGQFRTSRDAKLTVLSDYFKHGFDGDGDDGGSCIDGRLTSTWNWCSKVAKKPYYNLLNLGGFQGFDGDWKDE